MKKFLMLVAVASAALLADSQWASAKRGGCGGGGRKGHGCCGKTMSCGHGGCGMTMGGCGHGCCGMMGHHGGHAMGSGAAFVGTEATLIVNLPEDAVLTIDGEATTSTSAQRVFVTPALEEGKEYEYTLKAKIELDGKVQLATAKVSFRAGETKPVELKVAASGAAAQ